MISAGNDMVSFNGINIIRTKQPAFYSKILSAIEIAQYGQFFSEVISFENYVWLLWSVKESAYKFLQRLNPLLAFSPTRFIVQGLKEPLQPIIAEFDCTFKEGADFDIISTWAGFVTYGSDSLYSRSLLYQNLLISVVNGTENFEHVYWGIKTIPDPDPVKQSAAVRLFLLERLQQIFINKNLIINKNKHGVPVLLAGGAELNIPVSLSHHQQFVGYSFYYDGRL